MPAWQAVGGRSAELTLPRLRSGWDRTRNSAAERSGTFRFIAPEWDAIIEHAARQAAAVADHTRRGAAEDPGTAAEAAWAGADTLHIAVRAVRNTDLRR